MSVLILETGGTDNLLLESGDNLLLDESGPQGYFQARAGVCRAGATRAGLFKPSLAIQIAGVTQRPKYEGFTITEYLDGSPNTCTFTAQGFTPVEGQELKVGYGHIGNLIFAGHITEVTYEVQGFELSDEVIYHVTAIDYTWMLNLRSTVTKRYYTQGINTIVADLLQSFTEGGFKTGYIPESLGTADATFQEVTPIDAIRELAKIAGAYFLVDYRKRVHIFSTLPTANPLTLVDATLGIEGFTAKKDLAQVRTRVRVAGRGTTTLSLVAAGSTTIPVEDTTPFYTSGGLMLVGAQAPSYTGVSGASGPGTLTGCTGIVEDIAQGEEVRVLHQADDAAAQTALAALLGGGHSGIATHYVSDTSLSRERSQALAQANLDQLKSPIVAIGFGTRNTRNPQATFMRPGLLISASLTTPTSVVADFRIQQVSMTVQAAYQDGDDQIEIHRQVSAQKHYRTMFDLLRQIGG